jgi:hypothetical protein
MNITDELALAFINELFVYFESSKMMWTRDDFVKFRLRELYKIEKIDDVKKLLIQSKETPGAHSLLQLYIDLGKEFLEINDQEMAYYDEECHSIDYFYFCFMDNLCEKYNSSLEVQTS